jgi:hypothetical protein
MTNEGYRHDWGKQFINELIKTFDYRSNDNYFIFIARNQPWPEADSPEFAEDTQNYSNDTWSRTTAIKRLDESNIYPVVPRFDWKANTVFDQWSPYEDLFIEGEEKQFYVLVDDQKVYKCIYNNKNAPSTSKPVHTSAQIIQTEDGYYWKFLYELTEEMKEFLTAEYMPVKQATNRLNTEEINQFIVQQQSVPGEVPFVELLQAGTYNFPSSRPTQRIFPVTNDRLSTRIRLSLQTTTTDNIGETFNPVGHVLYLSDGRGPEIGTKKRIIAYNASKNEVQLEEPLGVETYIPEGILKGTSYKILPDLVIDGDGEGCEIIGNITNSIIDGSTTVRRLSSVSVINGGKDYSLATVRIRTSAIDTSVAPTFSVLLGPNGGHGSNALNELGCRRALIKTSSNTDRLFGDDWFATNEFRQFGIVKNPILGGTNNVAGSEFDRIVDLTIQKPYGITDIYRHDVNLDTYKPGNLIIGKDSNATGEVVAWRKSFDDRYSILTVKNVKGSFVTGSVIEDLVRITLSATNGNTFDVGETITQNDFSGAVTASGVVIGEMESLVSGVEYFEVHVSQKLGAFAAGLTLFRDEASEVIYPVEDVLSVQVLGGELLKQLEDVGGVTGYTFVRFSGDQDYGRIVDVSNGRLFTDEAPTYSTVTRLEVSGTGFNSNTFPQGATIGQTNDTTKTQTQSTVFAWKNDTTTTGTILASNVVGNFQEGLITLNGASTDHSITNITNPEVVLGSGQVVYIQNIRPVERSFEQEEDFKILIGF